jgi:predicted Zn-dependent protease
VQTPHVHDAQELLVAGDIKGARAVMAKLLDKHPDAAVLLVACKIELADASPASVAACDRAAQPQDGSADSAVIVDAAIAVVPAVSAAHDVRGAVRILANAQARIGSDDHARAAWLAIADAYRDLDAVSAAEYAVAKAGAVAPDDRGIAAWVATTRARFGIPKGTPDESEAIAAVREVLVLVNKGKLDDAAKALAASERRWPALPGLVAERCDIAIHRRELAAAHESCARAADRGSSWALYLDGSLDLETGANGSAATKLHEAIVLDPELRPAWSVLGKALARAKSAKLDQLRVDYKARFHRALPE